MNMITAIPLSKRRMFNKTFFGIVLFAILIFSLVIDPHRVSVSDCAFRNLTGYPCPTCGLTRSFYAMTRLNLSDAFMYHPFGPVLFILALGATVKFLVERIVKKEIIVTRLENHRFPLYILLAGTWIGFWLLRIAL